MRLPRIPASWPRVSFVGVLLASCSGTPDGTVNIVTGEETDVFTRAPAPVTLVTETIALDGTRTEISRAQLPVDDVRLGDQQRTAIGALGVTGLDATGKAVVRGETLHVQWGALENVALQLFVQRTGELARLPNGPAAFDPVATTVIAGRYLFGANGTSTILYDLLALKPIDGAPPVLPRPARSVASVGTAIVVIDQEGATTFELGDGSTFPLTPPSGGTFAEVAGGLRTGSQDATQYIVGATRTSGGPTPRIFLIDAESKASFAALIVPREGACATYVEGRGLVVVGGDAAGAGAEVLAAGAPLATPLPFPPDPVRGCGAATLDTSHVLVVGGGSARVLDLACTQSCAPLAWPDPVPLVRAEAFALGPDAAFVVGDDESGATHAYRVSATGTREIPLRIPRRGGRLLPTPTRALTVFGGGPGIEQYID
jgi:hypothetical protein